MGIIGISYTKILSERTGSTNNKKVEISTAPLIKDVKESAFTVFGAEAPVLNINFIFKSTFKPSIGSIEMHGILIYKPENIDEILNTWKKSKKIPQKNQIELTNYIFTNVSIKALMISDLMQLPPIINLPHI